jgi:hypothetical protein
MVALLPIAERFVAAIHDEGPDVANGALAGLHAMPAPDGITPVYAFMTVLAAMVDPDRPQSGRLAWVAETSAARLVRLRDRISA